jgi:predicted transcriptional regulator
MSADAHLPSLDILRQVVVGLRGIVISGAPNEDREAELQAVARDLGVRIDWYCHQVAMDLVPVLSTRDAEVPPPAAVALRDTLRRMEKTSVYLTKAERLRLAHLAAATGRSQSAILREAIAAYEPRTADARDFSVAGVTDGPPDDIAAVEEEQLLAGFGE